MSLPTPTARQAALPEDLTSTLVSSVTTAVTQHLSALIPSPSAAPSTNSQSSSTTYPVVQSVSSDHAATLVQDALGDVHSTISGQPSVHLILQSNCLLNHFIALVCLLICGYQTNKGKNMEGRVCRFHAGLEYRNVWPLILSIKIFKMAVNNFNMAVFLI